LNIIYNILQYEGYRNAWDTPSCIANLLSNLTVYTKKPSNKTCCCVSLFVIEGCSRKYDWTYISICKKHVKIYTTIARSDFLGFSIKSRMAEVGLHRLKMADRSDCRVSLAHRNAKRRYSTRLCRAYTCVRVCVRVCVCMCVCVCVCVRARARAHARTLDSCRVKEASSLLTCDPREHFPCAFLPRVCFFVPRRRRRDVTALHAPRARILNVPYASIKNYWSTRCHCACVLRVRARARAGGHCVYSHKPVILNLRTLLDSFMKIVAILVKLARSFNNKLTISFKSLVVRNWLFFDCNLSTFYGLKT